LAPYNTYYEGLRDDLLGTGLAAAVSSSSVTENSPAPPLQCASNKWKQPVELSKLEIPQVGAETTNENPSPASSNNASTSGSNKTDDAAMQTPILLPASQFHILFCPIVSFTQDGDGEALYCQALAQVLQSSPFRLPVEYERQALAKADRMRNLQQLVKRSLNEEQQKRFEEELNRGFRDWLVTSGNLRQVLDLVHMEENEQKI